MRRIDEAPEVVRDDELESLVVARRMPDDPGVDPRLDAPRWLRVLAFVAAGAVLAFGSIGLLLAVLGVYRPALAYALGAVVWLGLIALVWPHIGRRAATPRHVHVAAVVALLAIVTITGWNAAHASQHVLINRDGGAYANEGRWIARHGSLETRPRIGPFADEKTLKYDSYAVYAMPDGTLQYQFAHLLPALLAEAYAVGGDRAMFRLPELLSGVALLAFFVLAWRLFRRPWFALAATLTLAFLIPQVSFSRDSYSEIPSQVLLFTALWLLTTDRILPPARVTFVAGLFLGALEAIRIDAAVFLVGIPPLLAIAWLASSRRADADRTTRADASRRIGAFALGLVPGFALGLVDLMHHSGEYYSDLSKNVKSLLAASAGALLVSAIVVALWPRVARVLGRVPARPAAAVAGAVVIIGGFGAWAVRAQIQEIHGPPVGLIAGLQGQEHQPVIDATHHYFEESLKWMQWYLGWPTLAVAIVGAGALVAALLLGRQLRALATAALLAPASLLYLWKAKAVPDHVWVDRRFVVSAFPALVLLAFGLAVFLFTRPGRGALNVGARIAAVAFAVIAIAYPIHAVRPVRNMTEQRGFLAVVHDACTKFGDRHAAVVVLERDKQDLFDDWVPQTLRGWCGAQVAIARGTPDPAMLSRLADGWAARGKELYVVAVSEAPVRAAVPGAALIPTSAAVNPRYLGQTLTHRPDTYVTQALSMVIARVPAK